MANALATWNLFERELFMTYATALGFWLPVYDGWNTINFHPLAHQIFDNLSGLGARLDLLQASLDSVAPEVAPKLAALRPTIRKLAGKRAEIAHGVWGVHERYPDDLLRQPLRGAPVRWTVADFDAVAEQFSGLKRSYLPVIAPLFQKAKARKSLGPMPAVPD